MLCLLLLLAGLAGLPPSANAQLDEIANLPRTKAARYALLIGIEGYTRAPRLQHTTNDVFELADTLQHRGNYAREHILQMTDDADAEAQRPTKENLLREIAEFVKLPDENDHVLVYFSGHGFRAQDGSLYLAPIDCDPDDPAATGIDVGWLREQLIACKAPIKFLILDSCHAGSERVLETSVVAGDLGRIFRRTKGVVTLASSLGEQKSQIWPDKQQSLFSYWLVQGLKGHADDDTDGEVDFQEIYDYVHRQVTRTAEMRIGRPQTPVRIIGPETPGTPIITQLRAQPLKTLLAEMADQLAWEIEIAQLSAVGVIEFYGGSEENPFLGGRFGVLGQYLAEQLHRNLISLGTGRFSVVDRQRLQEAFSGQNFALKDLESTSTLKALVKDVGTMPGMVVGRIVQRDGALVHLSAKVVQTDRPYESGHTGGAAVLGESEWGMLGGSIVVRPEDRQYRTDIAPPSQGYIRPASATIVDHIDSRSRYATNPLRDPDFPFRIKIIVDGKQRPVVFHSGQAYVALAKGEVYAIDIEYRNPGGRWHDVAFMRLLVDGLNTMYEEEVTKGVQVRHYGMRVNLQEARRWVLDSALNPRRIWRVTGFFEGDKDYREFVIDDAENSLAARQRFTKNIGLITAAFYAPKTDAERAAELGTRAGRQHQRKTEIYKGDAKLGRTIGEVNLRYVSPEALERLGN